MCSWVTYIGEEEEGEKVNERVRQLLVLLAGGPDLTEGRVDKYVPFSYKKNDEPVSIQL